MRHADEAGEVFSGFDGVRNAASDRPHFPQICYDTLLCCDAVGGKGFDAPIIVVLFIS